MMIMTDDTTSSSPGSSSTPEQSLAHDAVEEILDAVPAHERNRKWVIWGSVTTTVVVVSAFALVFTNPTWMGGAGEQRGGSELPASLLYEEEECGNEILEGEEECDDGNTENGDGCNEECMSEYVDR